MKLRDYFQKAQDEGFAIGAFNIDTLETLKAVIGAAKVKKSPVIVEFSPGEVGYFGLENVVDLVENEKAENRDIPIFLNLDHGKSPESVLAAVDLGGFDEVHFDGSDFELEENIKGTLKVVEAAHKKEILVEGEFNKVSGASQVHGEDEELNIDKLKESYTDPKKASEFVQATGVDILASVFGNIHGTFTVQPDLDISLLIKIQEAVSDTFLSMHGGSGIAADQVKEAISKGRIVKINVNTELRKAYRDALTEEMQEKPEEYAYYKIIPDVVLAVQAVVESKIEVFGSANKI